MWNTWYIFFFSGETHMKCEIRFWNIFVWGTKGDTCGKVVPNQCFIWASHVFQVFQVWCCDFVHVFFLYGIVLNVICLMSICTSVLGQCYINPVTISTGLYTKKKFRFSLKWCHISLLFNFSWKMNSAFEYYFYTWEK